MKNVTSASGLDTSVASKAASMRISVLDSMCHPRSSGIRRIACGTKGSKHANDSSLHTARSLDYSRQIEPSSCSRAGSAANC